ncbi:MAG: hypothetical protein JW866_01990 [Ignavibacteriales bacterium]|nr:hypothetical protein [Ignavibacteriales bacterium]
MNLYKSKDGICNSIVFLAPALNVKEDKYFSLTEELRNHKTDVNIISINDFEKDKESTIKKTTHEFLESYRRESKVKEVPIYFIGYSFGALLGLYLLQNYSSDIKFDKMVLVAPAIAFRIIPNISKNISAIPLNFSLASLTPKNYRIYDKIPIFLYRIVSQLNKKLREERFKNLNIPTKIFISPKDEFISYKGIQNIIPRYNLANWNIVKIKNEKKKGLKDFYHLIADKNTLGETEWSLFLSEVKEFFRVKC